jgi:hypothetical protein
MYTFAELSIATRDGLYSAVDVAALPSELNVPLPVPANVSIANEHALDPAEAYLPEAQAVQLAEEFVPVTAL